MSQPTLTIEEVEKAFKIWRSNKNGTHPEIPESLCKQVKTLLESYRHSEVLRRLGLTKEQVRNKGLLPFPREIVDKAKHPKSNTFIEIPVTQAKPDTLTPSLILKRGDSELSLNFPSDGQIQLIINTLLK